MIRVAIVGIGNCASALIQGIHYYRETQTTRGLIIPHILGFAVKDIEIVAGFDVDADKVGRPLEEAIFRGNNNTSRVSTPPQSECFVSAAPRFDGVGIMYEREMTIVTAVDSDVREVLASTKPDVLVNYLPVGSDEGTKYWATLCLDLKIGFVNAIPSFIVSDPEWSTRFTNARVPCVGDDVKSQIGATIIHRALVSTFEARGGSLKDTYQLNFGGNMDFMNMREGDRLASKRISKTNSVVSQVSQAEPVSVHISPTDFVEYLTDNKIAYINLRGTGFAASPIEIEMKMSVWDSPNSAAVVVDAIRFVAAAKREGVGGPLSVCDFYFKSPPEQRGDLQAERRARELARRDSFAGR